MIFFLITERPSPFLHHWPSHPLHPADQLLLLVPKARLDTEGSRHLSVFLFPPCWVRRVDFILMTFPYLCRILCSCGISVINIRPHQLAENQTPTSSQTSVCHLDSSSHRASYHFLFSLARLLSVFSRKLYTLFTRLRPIYIRTKGSLTEALFSHAPSLCLTLSWSRAAISGASRVSAL